MAKYLSNLKVFPALTTTDPAKIPVNIIGLLENLKKIKFEDVSCKFASRVVKEDWTKAISQLVPAPTDSCPLYLTGATVYALPDKCSRHNTPSRAHAITKIAKARPFQNNETFVLVCDRACALASACAVSRGAHCYTAKSVATKGDFQIEFLLVGDHAVMDAKEAKAIEETCRGVMLAASIIDAPPNEINTEGFLNEVQKVGKLLQITPTIIRDKELQERGMGGIYGVGQASEEGGALVILSHKPKGASESIAWVGKGITYDTGGLSMKTKTTMPGMKRDCGGAAGVLGAFYATVKAGFSENLHAVFCLAENAVGPKATRPDDIHTLYSGKTVEINNTDAEGRLVLADGVVYASRDLKCSVIVDIATLTSAQGVCTGKFHGAVLTNDEMWEQKTILAGKITGDLVHPIVFTPELHFSEFASSVADMKNSVKDGCNAASSCAGLFIFSHLGFEFGGSWIHLDMASPSHLGERATGYGVALLLGMFSQYSKNEIVRGLGEELAEDRPCIYKRPRLE